MRVGYLTGSLCGRVPCRPRRPAATLQTLTPLFPSSSFQTSTATGATDILRKRTEPLTAPAATVATVGAAGLFTMATHFHTSN